jgi:catechol 2,3-dioxygenase-like lactoylglutathione lyase family enzyme
MPVPYPPAGFAYPAVMEAIDHLDLVVGDLDRSLIFYRGLLRFLGYVGEGPIVGEQGERVVYLHRHDGDGTIGLRQRRSGEGPHDRYALGLHHLALAAPSRACVEEIAAWAAANGARIESGPAEYGYTPGYYAVFLRDPDDLKLEVLHRPREEDLARRVAELERRLDERG